MNVVIIPARGGSQRIPRKNIKVFGGRPLIAWSIEAALNSALIEKVYVSTDDEEIAYISNSCGAIVPFKRSNRLSGNHTGTGEVIKDAVEWLMDNECSDIQNICCLYPTAPFVRTEDLDSGLNMLKESRADFVVSVTTFPYPIERALTIKKNQRIEMLHEENIDVRSQDLTTYYHDAGQFYWGKKSAWLEGKKIFLSNALPIILPRYRVIDIDTEEDWLCAEHYLEILMKNYKHRV